MGSATVRYGILVPTAATLLLSAGTVYAYGGPGFGAATLSDGSVRRYENSSSVRHDDVESIADAMTDANPFLDRADNGPDGTSNGPRAHTRTDAAAGHRDAAATGNASVAPPMTMTGVARVPHDELKANGWRGPPHAFTTR